MHSAEQAWRGEPPWPLLEDGAVDVWWADLAEVPQGLTRVLCAEEHARAMRIVDSARRELWMRSRAVLRELLRRYLGADPENVMLASTSNGKPILVRSPGTQRWLPNAATSDGELFFNLSHSGETALYAISSDAAVGVDVENRAYAADYLVAARRAFGAAAANRLAVLDPAARRTAFLRAWVRKEAEMKCRGYGIGAPQMHSPGELWTRNVPAPLGGAAALAVAVTPTLVRYASWQAGVQRHLRLEDLDDQLLGERLPVDDRRDGGRHTMVLAD